MEDGAGEGGVPDPGSTAAGGEVTYEGQGELPPDQMMQYQVKEEPRRGYMDEMDGYQDANNGAEQQQANGGGGEEDGQQD